MGEPHVDFNAAGYFSQVALPKPRTSPCQHRPRGSLDGCIRDYMLSLRFPRFLGHRCPTIAQRSLRLSFGSYRL